MYVYLAVMYTHAHKVGLFNMENKFCTTESKPK